MWRGNPRLSQHNTINLTAIPCLAKRETICDRHMIDSSSEDPYRFYNRGNNIYGGDLLLLKH